ncbi:MAG TPA: tyrosine-type recombinase/integrase [Methanomicrobiales archaeon]|nr:tyrosine-type recombinase/integrase [Methanomicrobiales archaeon]
MLEPWVAKYVNDLRNGRRNLAADLGALEGDCRSRRTCLAYQSAIRTLLAGADLTLLPREGRELRRARSRPGPRVPADTLTPGMILKLLEHLDTRGRAILYVLVSSGSRLGEALSLRLDDLDLGSRPARFRIRDAEGKISRVAFISREAAGAIRVYLIVRDRFLASARSRGGTGGPDLLFPIGTRTFEQVWALALSKARLERFDPVTGRRTLPPGATRRFFATRMGAVLPAPVVRELMGGPGRFAAAHRGFTDEELEKAFLEGEPHITLHRSRRKESLGRKVAELEGLVRALRHQIEEAGRMPMPPQGTPREG